MEKCELNDLTFLMPIRIDTIDRLENITIVIEYILSYFDTNIIVCEIDERNKNLLQRLLPATVQYKFIRDYDQIFYRTKYINELMHYITTPYVAIWDADVIVSFEQILESIEALRTNSADFVYPYTNIMYNVPNCVKNIEVEDKLLFYNEIKDGFSEMYGPKCVGGGFLANKDKYISSGMENINFYGWGVEDGERILRWKRLDYIIKHVPGVMYHLNHGRGLNSVFHNVDQDFIKQREFHRIRTMDIGRLKLEILKWA